MHVAVTGRNGQVARSLLERTAGTDITITTVARPEIDLMQAARVETVLRALKPDAVVNAAAYTAVDMAESEPDEAHAVNGAGAAAVARAAEALGIPVVQLSTDYVFDGSLDRPYSENDTVNPVSIYGQSKLAGERAVAEATNNYAILRTAWVYSPFGKNFPRTMLAIASKRDEISVVGDQVGAPSNALDIADGALSVVRNLVTQPRSTALRGVFHMTAAGEASWAQFAEAIFASSATAGGPTARVMTIPSSAYPTKARRPANSRLDNAKLAQIHDVRLPDWRLSLPAIVARLVALDF